MKRRLLTGLFIIVFVLGSFVAAAGAADYRYLRTAVLFINDTTAVVNDQELKLEVAPYIKAGRTLIPLRFMEKALIGAKVDWNGSVRTATLTIGSKEVKVTVGNKTAYVNGQAVIMDVPAEIRGSRTFVPLRFISENLGAKVEYQAETKTIILTHIDKTSWKSYVDAVTGVKIRYPYDWQVRADKTGLQLETPNLIKIQFKAETSDLPAIIKEQKDSLINSGWEVVSEEAVDPANQNVGTGITAIKFNQNNPEVSEIYALSAIKAEKGTYSISFFSKIPSSAEQDLLIYENMVENMVE